LKISPIKSEWLASDNFKSYPLLNYTKLGLKG
jgi:hypothetical protein